MSQIVLSFNDWSRIQESSVFPSGNPEALNEGEISDFLHGVADFTSMAADFIVPGSGAVIDIINAIGYFIEANLLKDETEASSATVAGFITLGSAALPAALQTLATGMKAALKKVTEALSKGASASIISAASGSAAKIVQFLGGISKSLSSIVNEIVGAVKKLMDTDLGEFITKQFQGADKFSTWVQKFFAKIKGFFDSLVTKIQRVFPQAQSPKITPKDVTEEGLQDAQKEVLMNRTKEITKQVLKRTSEFVVQRGGLDTPTVKSKIEGSPSALRAGLTNSGFGEKPQSFMGFLKRTYEKNSPKDVVLSGEKGILVSFPKSEIVFTNKRYFQYPPGGYNKGDGRGHTQKGSWKFVSSSSSPSGLTVERKPDA